MSLWPSLDSAKLQDLSLTLFVLFPTHQLKFSEKADGFCTVYFSPLLKRTSFVKFLITYIVADNCNEENYKRLLESNSAIFYLFERDDFCFEYGVNFDQLWLFLKDDKLLQKSSPNTW